MDFAVPMIAKLIRRGMNELFPEERILVSNHGLRYIDDAAESALVDPEHRVLATVAEQYNIGSMNYITLDGRLFFHPQMIGMNRAVMLLHEYPYNHARRLGQTNSRYTRELVGWLITHRNGRTVNDLIEAANQMGFLISPSRLQKNGGTPILGADAYLAAYPYYVVHETLTYLR